MNKIIKLMEKSSIKKAKLSKFKKGIDKEMKMCIKKYKKELVDCIMISKTLQEAKHCKDIKKKGLLKERECTKVIEHSFKIMKDDPKLIEKTKAFRKLHKKDEIKKCIDNFNKTFNYCILKSKTYKEIESCK
jgi:hypothetical protein